MLWAVFRFFAGLVALVEILRKNFQTYTVMNKTYLMMTTAIFVTMTRHQPRHHGTDCHHQGASFVTFIDATLMYKY